MSNKRQSVLKNNDFIAGVVIVLFSVVSLLQIQGLKNSHSKIFPYATLAIVLISGINLLVQPFINQKKQCETKQKLFGKKELIMLAVLGVACFLIKILGFYTSIFLLIFFSYLYVEGTWSETAVKAALLYSVICTILLYVSFSVLLGMVTPTGLFF